MRSALTFLFGFCLAHVVADTSEYAEVARKAMAEEREQVREAKVEDVDGASPAFDSQLQAANGELNNIMSGMDKYVPQNNAASNVPMELGDSASGDFAPEDAMSLHLAQLQSKVRASNSVLQKLRGAVMDRDREIHKAEGLMAKELAAIETSMKEKKQEAAEVKQLQTEQAALQDHIDESKRQLQESEHRAHDEELKRASSGTDAAKLRNDLKAADAAEAADERKLADFKHQAAADSAQSNAKIQELQATIKTMQSQVAGGIASHVRWEKNSTALVQRLQEARASLQSILVAKQASDVDMSQVVGRWKDSLAQLRNQVQMNAQLQQRAQQDGQSVVDHLNDLKQQIRDRDERITQLKQHLQQR